MSSLKETTDEMVHMKVRTFVALLVSIVTVTNSFSIIYQKILRTEQTQMYNKERADRIADRKLQEAKDYIHLRELENELKNCKNNGI